MSPNLRLLVGAVAALAVGAVQSSAAAAATCAPAKAAKAAKEVRYVARAGVPADLTSLDVYSPSRSCRRGKPAPVVLWVHGGAYQIGDKTNGMRDKVAHFNRRGWTFVSVNYRLTTPGKPRSARYPDHFRDVAAAVAWTRRSIARYGGDPRRLALLGHSAGADIVANVADDPRWLRERDLVPSALRCAGPLDTEGFDKPSSGPNGRAQWAAALGNQPGYETLTSPSLYVKSGLGIAETITVVRGAPRRRAIQTGYAAALRAAGVRTTTIDASALSHAEVSERIGARGDEVMTPPLTAFLTRCFKQGAR